LAGQSLAQRQFFAFTRGIEASADQAGMTFLDQTHQSTKGFLEFMQILETQEFINSAQQDPYLRTHPLSIERVDWLRKHVSESPWTNTAYPPDYFAMHARMKAKLVGFMYPLDKVLQLYPETDTSLEGRYARAIAYYRVPDLTHALPLIDGLIKENPKDPYFYELKGQMLFENGKLADALAPYQMAVKLMPTAALIRIDLAQVEVESNDPKLLPQALAELTEAKNHEHDVPKLWRLMGVAYGRQGDLGQAASALAQEALLEGRRDDARDQARRAMRMLPPGSPGWLRAQDVENAATRGKRDPNE
jgi:predicted Zn-dependent protease